MSQLFLENGLKLTWAATMRADQGARMAEEEFELSVRSGLRRVLTGVESGSQEMMDWLKKDIKIDDVFICAERCQRHDVAAIFPFIVGFPGESQESVDATLSTAKKLRSMHPGFETPIFYFKPYPGSAITMDVVKNGYQLPQTIEEWGEFDYVGSAGPWVNQEKYRLIERFKFYNRIAWGKSNPLYWPLRALARWRCTRDQYGLPIEKSMFELLRPAQRLS